jgi:hypothetical protein
MPNRFTPISSKVGIKQALQQINRNFQALDAESNTKTIRKGGETAMVSGRLPNGRYGDLKYGGNIPQGLFGQAPVDGRVGLWITKPGIDVLEEIK